MGFLSLKSKQCLLSLHSFSFSSTYSLPLLFLCHFDPLICHMSQFFMTVFNDGKYLHNSFQLKNPIHVRFRVSESALDVFQASVLYYPVKFLITFLEYLSNTSNI